MSDHWSEWLELTEFVVYLENNTMVKAAEE